MSGSGRRTRLAAVALVLAVLGSLLDAVLHYASLWETWPPLLVASWAPPALSALAGRTTVQRGVCLAGAVVTGLVAVVLLPFGYGLWQLPSVVLLALAARGDPRP